MRRIAQRATRISWDFKTAHTVFLPVESLLFLLTHIHSHVRLLQGICLPYLLLCLGRTAVVLSWPRPSSAAVGDLPADGRWMWRFSVSCGRSSEEGVLSSECQRSRGASYAQAVLNRCSRILSVLQNVKLGHDGRQRSSVGWGVQLFKRSNDALSRD